jgi:Asp-tRNA(Asn)/Glu-tRNA(Gln) amidotransferase A subunit family amidase
MSPDDSPIPLDAASIADGVTTGRLDPAAVTEAFLAQIVGRNGMLNAVVDFDPTPALREVGGLRGRIAAGDRLPLAGEPVVVKDYPALPSPARSAAPSKTPR